MTLLSRGLGGRPSGALPWVAVAMLVHLSGCSGCSDEERGAGGGIGGAFTTGMLGGGGGGGVLEAVLVTAGAELEEALEMFGTTLGIPADPLRAQLFGWGESERVISIEGAQVTIAADHDGSFSLDRPRTRGQRGGLFDAIHHTALEGSGGGFSDSI